MAEEINFKGNEGQHYKAIESLHAYYGTKNIKASELVDSLSNTVNDWHVMMGRSSALPSLAQPYLSKIKSEDVDAARNLYLYLSPIFYYVQALHETSRDAWRNAVTMCGIFSERIVRNIFEEFDRNRSTNLIQYFEQDGKFENRVGRLKKELEERKFQQADDLYGSLKKIYVVRNRMGPHDVPPPLPIQAKISINGCLPAYMEYLDTLIFLGTKLDTDYEGFISFFNETTKVKSQLVWGQENQTVSAKELLKDHLYKGGVFSNPKNLAEILQEMKSRRYTFSKTLVATILKELANGRDAILTRKKIGNNYVYSERLPPSVYFKSEF